MKNLMILVAVAAVAGAHAQTILTEWNFNGTGLSTTAPAPSTGMGTASLVGGTTGAFSGGSPNDPATTNDNRWNSSTYAAQGTESGQRGVRFNVATTGWVGITVKYDQRFSNTSSRFTRFEYTLDGTNFITTGLANAGVTENTLGGDMWNVRNWNLTSIAGANNNANFGFRVVSVFGPTAATYIPSNSGSSYATTGTLGYDLVSVSYANPVPEPATMAAIGIGVAAMIRRRRKSN
jgi:hypothetical protein